jgi:hypothetical protein
VIRYGQYGRKASRIVKNMENMEERQVEMWKYMDNMEERNVK